MRNARIACMFNATLSRLLHQKGRKTEHSVSTSNEAKKIFKKIINGSCGLFSLLAISTRKTLTLTTTTKSYGTKERKTGIVE